MPRTVALFNGHDVMDVEVQSELVWHKHDDTDDFFLVLKIPDAPVPPDRNGFLYGERKLGIWRRWWDVNKRRFLLENSRSPG